MKSSPFLYVAGRSGGHIVPLLALAQKKQNPSLFITTATPLDMQIMHDARHLVSHHYPIELSNLPKSIFHYPAYLIKVIKEAWRIRSLLKLHKPKALYTTGGYIGALVSLVAWFMGIPIHVYHLDAIAGKAGAFIHHLATSSYICIPGAEKHLSSFSRARIEYTQCPLRFEEKDIVSREDACKELDISPDKKIFLIIGGSQGSVSINSLIKDALQNLSEKERKNIAILHQTGKADEDSLCSWYARQLIEAQLFGYNFNLAAYYNAADWIISRAGAGSLAEICFFQKKALIFPLKGVAQNHQVYNALAYKKMHPLFIQPFLSDDKKEQIAALTSLFQKDQ